MLEYLSINGVAEYLDVSVNSVKGYRRKSLTDTDRPDAVIDESSDYVLNVNHFPAPDVKVGNAYGWSQESIDAWNASRPRPGGGRPGPARKASDAPA
ncbi:hypothetical protein CH253_08000 [Rhodococcus sp. 06-156-3C]|uniref:hypothetical protein n=1 Tax=Rhodococcus sp. 06-156-3C TaxID=2022486 RepID=UPI000B9B0AF2|nr:hypothetical protein [Rhodococcus sp. 06-156-3C]OZD23795.1 hypothetical protein CH253_08000 [Rhodococcus sp. 06-156-3C]